jgi:ubiquinone/menaquinone biosynthesis C-methylase UbiE
VRTELDDAELYEQVLVPALYKPWAEMLVDRARLDHGQSVIELVCGTGILSRVARDRVGRDARVVAIDQDPDMLAIARRIEQTIDWRVGNAITPPVRDDESFDAAFCNQGIPFVRDKGSMTKAMRRVLRPGGRAIASAWRSLAENALFADILVVAERIVGRIEDTRYGFTDPDALARLFVDAGFRDVQADQVSLTAHFRGNPIGLARLNAIAVVAMSEARARPLTERAELVSAIAAASVNEVRWRFDGDAFSFSTSANVAIGHV